jgi:hypothetical protein
LWRTLTSPVGSVTKARFSNFQSMIRLPFYMFWFG